MRPAVRLASCCNALALALMLIPGYSPAAAGPPSAAGPAAGGGPAAGAGSLPPQIAAVLQDCRASGVTPERVEALNGLLDRTDLQLMTRFKEEALRLGGGKSELYDAVLDAVDRRTLERSLDLAGEVARELGDGVEIVVRTGSSGQRHLQLTGKSADAPGYKPCISDDDISFVGPKAEEAANRFNARRAARSLDKAKVKAFPMKAFTDTTDYDLLVKQFRDPDAFVGAAGFGLVKGETARKGAVVLTRQAGAVVPAAESVGDYVARNARSTLAEIMDLAAAAQDLRQFGPLTVYGSATRQLGNPNLPPRERVKQLLRIHASMEASGAFAEAARLGGPGSPSHFQSVGRDLMAAYRDPAGEGAAAFLRNHSLQALQLDCYESVMLSTATKLQAMVARAEREAGRGAVNMSRHPELRRMIHEMAAGFALLQEIGHSDIVSKILSRLEASGAREGSLLFKVLYTAATDAASLSPAFASEMDRIVTKGVGTWSQARNPQAFAEGLAEAGAGGAKQRKVLAGVAAERMAGKTGGESARQLERLLAEPRGDSYLWQMLASDTGKKFAIEAIVLAPFALFVMYQQWQAGEMHDMSDAAAILIEFVPGGMTFKKSLIEGMNRQVVLSFIREALYFTPAWPLVLSGDMIYLAWTLGEASTLQYENEGLIDILAYNGDFEPAGDGYHLTRLVLPGGDAVARDDIRRWLFETKAVRLKHTVDGLEYYVNNLSEKSYHVFNDYYAANDPKMQQVRQAVQEQLNAMNWDEASKYFLTEGNASGYLLWLAGIEYVCTDKSKENWCRVYMHLKDTLEERKKVIFEKEMTPRLIALAEERYATLRGEDDLAPKFDGLQAKLEALRGNEGLGVTLKEQVKTRADALADKSDSVVFGRTVTRDSKRMTRGRYWTEAYAAYSRVYEISRSIETNIRERTGYAWAKPLRFKWTGDYQDDLRRAEQSKAGFAHDLRRITADITKLKGAAPELADSTDAKALGILAEVVFPWRRVLDESDQAEPDPGSAFHAEYAAALEKVKALYKLNADFSAQLRSGARIEVAPEPILLDKSCGVELVFQDASLRKENEAGALTVIWSAEPAGKFVGGNAGARVRFAPGQPAAVLLTARVERQGRKKAAGAVSRTVELAVPDGFLTLDWDPPAPAPREPVTFRADYPEKYYGGSSGFRYSWSGENCAIADRNASTVTATAPALGTFTVEVRILTEDAAGGTHVLARKKAVLDVIGPEAFAVVIENGKEQFETGEEVNLRARAQGVTPEERRALRYQWIKGGKAVQEGARFATVHPKPGKHRVEARASLDQGAGKPPRSAGAALAYDVVTPQPPLFDLVVRGPASARVNDDVRLEAVLTPRNPAAKLAAKNAWIEWQAGGTVYETGPVIRPDTSRPGTYAVDAVAVRGTPREKTVVASQRHEITIEGGPGDGSGETSGKGPGETGPGTGPGKTPEKGPAGTGTAASAAGTITWQPVSPNTHCSTVVRAKFGAYAGDPEYWFYLEGPPPALPTCMAKEPVCVHTFEKPGRYQAVVKLIDKSNPTEILSGNQPRIEAAFDVGDGFLKLTAPAQAYVGDRFPLTLEVPAELAAGVSTYEWNFVFNADPENTRFAMGETIVTTEPQTMAQASHHFLEAPVYARVLLYAREGVGVGGYSVSSPIRVSMPDLGVSLGWQKTPTANGFAMTRSEVIQTFEAPEGASDPSPTTVVVRATISVDLLYSPDWTHAVTSGEPFKKGKYEGFLETNLETGNGDVVKGSARVSASYERAWLTVNGEVYGFGACCIDAARAFNISETRRAYDEMLSAIRGMSNIPSLEAAADLGPLAVKLESDAATLAPGEIALVRAAATGGKPPYAYAWQGHDESGASPSEVKVRGASGASRTVSVTITDSAGAAASASLPIGSRKLDVAIEMTDPASDRIFVGGTASFRALLTSAGAAVTGPYRFQWQPHPEVEFTPYEGTAPTAAARFPRPGPVRVWVRVVDDRSVDVRGGFLATVAESQQLTIEVVEPRLTIELDPQKPFVGEEVRAKLKIDPDMPDKDLSIRWMPLSANATQFGKQEDREIVFFARNTEPVSIKVLAMAAGTGDDLGQAEAAISALPFEVKVSAPRSLGPVPRIWKEGFGLVDAPSGAIAVFQDVTVSAEVRPQPTRLPLRYQWTVTPEGCTLSAPGSAETRANASRTGTYAFSVVVRNADGVELGAGAGQVAVTIGGDQMKGPSPSELARKKLEEARRLLAEGNLDSAIPAAEEAARIDPKGTEARDLAARLLRERTAALDNVRKMDDWIQQNRVPEAEKALTDAGRVHPRFAPVLEAGKRLETARKKAEAARAATQDTAKRLRSEAAVLEQKGDLPGAISKYRESLKYAIEPGIEERIALLEKKIKDDQDAEAKKARAKALRDEGAALQQKGDLPGAVARYRESLKYWPDPELEKHIALLEKKIKDTQDTDAKKDKARALRDEGAALQQKGDIPGAVARYRESLKYWPDPKLEEYIRATLEPLLAAKPTPTTVPTARPTVTTTTRPTPTPARPVATTTPSPRPTPTATPRPTPTPTPRPTPTPPPTPKPTARPTPSPTPPPRPTEAPGFALTSSSWQGTAKLQGSDQTVTGTLKFTVDARGKVSGSVEFNVDGDRLRMDVQGSVDSARGRFDMTAKGSKTEDRITSTFNLTFTGTTTDARSATGDARMDVAFTLEGGSDRNTLKGTWSANRSP